jgi:hypothetical protein
MSFVLNGITLDSRLIAEAVLSLRSMQADELMITFSGPCDIAQIPAGAAVTLTDPSGVTVFRGEAVLVQGSGQGAKEQNIHRSKPQSLIFSPRRSLWERDSR